MTDEWVNLAYGKITPEDSSIDWLTNDWPFNTKAGLENNIEKFNGLSTTDAGRRTLAAADTRHEMRSPETTPGAPI